MYYIPSVRHLHCFQYLEIQTQTIPQRHIPPGFRNAHAFHPFHNDILYTVRLAYLIDLSDVRMVELAH